MQILEMRYVLDGESKNNVYLLNSFWAIQVYQVMSVAPKVYHLKIRDKLG